MYMATVRRSRHAAGRQGMGAWQKLRRCGNELPRRVHYRVIALTVHLADR